MAFHTRKALQYVKILSRGFTLVELIVVVAILGIIFVGVVSLFNPSAQINKAQNATRQHDLEEIKTALDTYYDDTGCYPTAVSFDRQFAVNSKIYMNNIPEDPLCLSNGKNCYIYQTDTTSTCPQWNVLYTKLQTPIAQNATCQLTSINSTCLPKNYQASEMNYCVISGKVDCSVIGSSSIQATPPPGGVNNPTPTQGMCQAYYACTGNVGSPGGGCNSYASQQQNCIANGGNVVCYCDSQCSGQCQ